jgi:hypothetical protein
MLTEVVLLGFAFMAFIFWIENGRNKNNKGGRFDDKKFLPGKKTVIRH